MSDPHKSRTLFDKKATNDVLERERWVSMMNEMKLLAKSRDGWQAIALGLAVVDLVLCFIVAIELMVRC